MSSIPKFHTKAKLDAEDRFKAARDERDRAESFLEELDEMISTSTELASEPAINPS